MANRAASPITITPRKARGAEFARWSKFHRTCRLVAFNQNPALNDYMLKRGVRLAGVDHLARHFQAGTPNSETHLAWILFSGSVECDAGGGFKAMNPGDVAICPANHPHWIRLASPTARGLWLHLNPVPRWARIATVAPGVYRDLALGHLRPLVDTYLLASPLRDAEDIGAEMHALELILFSLEKALDQIVGAKRHALQARIKALEGRIQANLEADWTVARLAAALGVSPSYLHKTTLRVLGIRPMGLVTKLRMNHAINRLLQTNMTLADIAAEVGFASPFAFSAAFKREIGRSPARFRASIFTP